MNSISIETERGGRMTSPIARSVWINLYKQLEREASKFPQYNYREFAKRRIRDHFEANRGVTDPEGKENLEVIRRQVALIHIDKMRECGKCKSNEYTNKNLVMMVNECGHPLCKNCVENLFARNAGPCHVCGKTLRKNNFWEQVFDDPLIEKETHIRRRLRKVYNLKKEDFPTLREFNDYLERFECLVCNLAYGIDVEETEAEIAAFKETHAELIERNKKKLDEDQIWIMQNLKEDREMKNRVDQAHNQENKEVERSAVKDTKAIMEELRESNVPAEVILDRERKQILQDRKRMAESMSFSTSQRMSGRAFEYKPPRLLINGPPIPSKEELEAKGYLQHIRAASLARVAGGFTTHTGCLRALFDSRVDLLNMTEPIDLSLAYQNISIFYSGVNNEESAAWLNSVQSSVQAWTLCDRILCERRDPLACCFAAQTLRQKIMKSLSELPKDAYLSLRESLISHLSYIDVSCHDQVADATATQLCLAVADLYIQVPEWKNWVNELLQRFSALEGDRTRMLLTLLRVFSEEVQFSKVGENRRNEIRSELAASGASVIAYLSQVLEGYVADHDMIKKVLLCLSAYLQNPALSTDQFAASPLLNNVFQILAAPNAPNFLHDAATECAVSALVRAEDHHAHQALAMSLQAAVYQLHGAFNQAVAMEDMDKLQNFARIFVELAESLLEKIVNEGSDDPNSMGSINTLELLLLLAGHHDYSLIEMTFNIWYRISEGLFSFEDDQHIEKFKPYVQRYLTALYRHCRYDTEEEGIPDRDGDFADFRLKVVETVRDVVFVVGTEACVRSMHSMLMTCSQSGTWDETEAALFIISTVIGNIIPEENTVVPELVTAIIGLPPTSHPALLLTSVELVGSANEWLSKNPSYLACTVLIMNLPEDGIRQRLTEMCQPIIQRLQMVLSSTPVISMNNENEKAADSWARIAGEPVLWIDRIATIFREVRPWNGAGSKSMNGNASEQAPWLDIATQLYGVLSESLKRYESTSRVVEHCCRSIRFIVRSLGVQSIGFVEPLITQMMDIFSRHQHSCFLYLSSILVDEYGGMESLQPGLMIMLETLAHGTFTVLTLENGPRDHPDTVDDLFRLAMRFVTRAPSAFFTHTVATALFECAMVCLSLDHQEANRSVTRFFGSIIEQLLAARKTGFRDAGVEAAEDLVIHHGAKLIELCLTAAIFKVTGSLRRDLAEIVYMLSKIDRGRHKEWLITATSRLPRGPLAATDEQLEQFRHKEWLITATSRLPRGPLAATDEQLEQFVANITADPERISLRDVHTQIRDLIKLYE
ncbi:CDK-activating kinase assembly factor MAT1 [Ostertagia ostertagi]